MTTQNILHVVPAVKWTLACYKGDSGPSGKWTLSVFDTGYGVEVSGGNKQMETALVESITHRVSSWSV